MSRFLPVRMHPLLHAGCIIAAAFLVYSNNYTHDYHLDDCHLIPDNPLVRSLKNIPSYFTDPKTLSVLPSNIDYRPLLQITYALNYRISGYATWSWHLVQIILHAVCAVSLYFFIFTLIRKFSPAKTSFLRTAAFAGALLFTVHPTGSGVVNYLSARSSLLTAAFLLPSFLAYMKTDGRGGKVMLVLSGILYTLALFTKVEAVGGLPVFFLYDCLQSAYGRKRPEGQTSSPFADMAATLNTAELRRIGLFIVVTAIYFIIRTMVMAGYDTGARSSADVTPLAYLSTQVTAWWYYVRNWVAPVRLVADMLTYPVYRSPAAPQVMLAIGGWLLVVWIIFVNYRKSPCLFFTVCSALALIAPTSSIAPLAEMVNEHRPYLPMAIFAGGWMVWLLTAGGAEAWRLRGAGVVGICGLSLVLASFFVLTRQRNVVFRTTEKYYEDIINKAPSSRAYSNYGLVFMQKGNYETARFYYEKSLELAPDYYIAHTNLGIVYDRLGNEDLARMHFNRAVETDQYSATARMYRGEFLLSRGEYADALKDFETVLPRHRVRYRICKGAATAAAGCGSWEKGIEYLKVCYGENIADAELDIVSISRPLWADSARCTAGIWFFRAADSLYPGRWWIHHNIGDLQQRCGDTVSARAEFSIAQSLKASVIQRK